MPVNTGFRILSPFEIQELEKMIRESVTQELVIQFDLSVSDWLRTSFTTVSIYDADKAKPIALFTPASLMVDLPNYFQWFKDAIMIQKFGLTPAPEPLPDEPVTYSRIGEFWPEESTPDFTAFRVARGAQIRVGDVEREGDDVYVAHIRHRGPFPFFVWQKIL